MNWLKEFCLHNYRNNWGLWFHLLVAVAGAKALLVCGFTEYAIMVLVSFVAVWWEFIELLYENRLKKERIIKNYGSVRHWVYDSVGDILIAIIGAGIVVL